jgi:23S rRNA (cytidine2498-2'-O)-methyltransferase
MPLDADRIFFSADPDYLAVAANELRAAIPDAGIEMVTPDLGAISAEGLAIADLAGICRDTPIAFVRHLMRGIAVVPPEHLVSPGAIAARALDAWQGRPLRDSVALQVWSSGDPAYPFRTDEVWQALAAGFRDRGIEVARGGREQVASAVITPQGLILGLNGQGSSLGDWPGGRVRLAKPKGQISRSEFKLEELFREHDPGFPDGGIAIDLGAAPGGWTRILRQHGFEVWSVDPGALDPRIATDPGVRHIATTARPFLDSTDVVADLIVNDMRMEPGLSTALMVEAARRVRTDGMMIQTLKVTPHHTLRVVHHALDNLDRAWEVVFARQLHHNRNEVTVVGRKR